MKYMTFPSPLGAIVVSTDYGSLTGVYFMGQKYFETIPKDWIEDDKNTLLESARTQINEYLEGKRQDFDLPLEVEGTPFQKKVWNEVAKIPYGTTVTYSKIAKNIGQPTAIRAVGTAIGRNPVCLIVPCHRVVGAQGALSGYAGGIERKEELLALEALE